MDSADPPLAVDRFYGDRHRQLRRPGKGGRDASALGDLLASRSTRAPPAHRPVPVRPAVCHQVTQRATRLRLTDSYGPRPRPPWTVVEPAESTAVLASRHGRACSPTDGVH